MRKVLAFALALGVALALAWPATAEPPRTYTGTSAAPAAVPGCNLSANWRVTASAQWDGTTFRYGVLNSPGALRHGGAADGTSSEFFLFRGSDRTWDGTYSDRDPAKLPRFVYRTISEGGPDFIRNVDKIVQVPMAPSGAFCLITIRRPG